MMEWWKVGKVTPTLLQKFLDNEFTLLQEKYNITLTLLHLFLKIALTL